MLLLTVILPKSQIGRMQENSTVTYGPFLCVFQRKKESTQTELDENTSMSFIYSIIFVSVR